MKPTLADTILPAMILAPSAHNTQPWEFQVKGDTSDVIDIFVDWKRHLRISDPTHRQLYISLGCTVTNAIIAARQKGYEISIHYFPEGAGHDAPVARLKVLESSLAPSTDTADLYEAVTQRRTDRSLFDGHPLTPDQQSILTSPAESPIHFIDDRSKINKIADITGHAMEITLSRSDFKEELSQWVRPSWTGSSDGMPGYAIGVPAPLSFLMPFIVRYAPIHKQEGPKARHLIKSVSAVIVLTTPEDSPLEWVKVGQTMELLWLRATAHSVAVMPMAAAIEAGAETRRDLQTIVGTQELPQAVLRVGHSQQHNLKALPRRPIHDCLR